MSVTEQKVVFVVDDGGLTHVNPDGRGFRIGVDSYQRVLELAFKHDLIIPIAVTAGFIDVDNLSGLGLSNPDSEALIQLFLRYRERIPVWNHGLTHSHAGWFTEFQHFSAPGRVSEEEQSRHLELSQKIFESVGLGTPRVLVPPGHAWEMGVTDRLAEQAGIRYIAIREFEKESLIRWAANPSIPYRRRWGPSRYLKTLYRLGLGVPHNKRCLTLFDYWKARQYVRPHNRLLHYLIHRTVRGLQPPHHFFAHIQNFSGVSRAGYWDKLMRQVQNSLGDKHAFYG